VPDRVVTDPARLRQVLLNLVGNAVKFTAAGSVRLVAEVTPDPVRGGHRFAVDVFDTGEGIPQDKLESIFDPFTQADASVTRKHGGTGLGLSISRQIAQHLGGTIAAASRIGSGSLFRVSVDAGDLSEATWTTVGPAGLPAEAFAADDGATCVLPRAIDPQSRVLLVDDGDVNRRLIRVVLGRAGVIPAEATNGRDAVQTVVEAERAGRPFDVVLMDMQMPIMDGYAAAAALRNAGSSVPIVALTAHAMSGDRAKCMEAGCTDYLSKPVRPADLLGLLGQLIPASPASEAPAEGVLAATTRPAMDIPADSSTTAAVAPEPTFDAPDDPPGRPPGCELPEEDADLWPIAAEFAASLPERLERCREMLSEGDAPGLCEAAHKLAGTAGTLGYGRFTAPAAALESAAEARWDEPVLLSLVDELSALSAAVRQPTPAAGAAAV
jgi:CheY-like chemotaxis protein/HPt (histidine-containing phosphotransfer) domain-containing protein